MSRESRGFRNNNPGNLIKTPIKWQGKVPSTDSRFEKFITLAYGVRALLVDVHSKLTGGKNTLRKLLTAYAPPFENNTEAYIHNVSKRTGFSPDQVITASRDSISKIASAIVIQENGSGITAAELESGWSLFPKKKILVP